MFKMAFYFLLSFLPTQAVSKTYLNNRNSNTDLNVHTEKKMLEKNFM